MPQCCRPGQQEISRIDDKRLGLLAELAQMSSEPDCESLSSTEKGIVHLRRHQDLPENKVLMDLGEPPLAMKNALVFSSIILRDATLIPVVPLNTAIHSRARSAMGVLVEGEIGGIVWQLQSLDNEIRQEAQQDLVILSWAAPGTLPMKDLQGLGLGTRPQYAPTTREDSRDGEAILGEWHEWEYLNVLIVNRESFGGLHNTESAPLHSQRSHQVPICRRTGVGVLHKNALKGQKVAWDRMALI